MGEKGEGLLNKDALYVVRENSVNASWVWKFLCMAGVKVKGF